MATIKQAIYEHGGSRIYRENADGSRMLLVDTYPGAFDGDNFAKAVYQFIVDYHALPVTTPRSEENFDG
jgi:phage gp37-like protein